MQFPDEKLKQVEMSFSSTNIIVDELLEEFMSFMKGCDYCFQIDDYLEINNDFIESSTPESQETEKSTLDEYDSVNDINDDHIVEYEITPQEILDEYDSTSVVSVSSLPYIEKIKELEETIVPFLENLKRDPNKIMLRWPNREEVIENQILKIKGIIHDIRNN